MGFASQQISQFLGSFCTDIISIFLWDSLPRLTQVRLRSRFLQAFIALQYQLPISDEKYRIVVGYNRVNLQVILP